VIICDHALHERVAPLFLCPSTERWQSALKTPAPYVPGVPMAEILSHCLRFPCPSPLLMHGFCMQHQLIWCAPLAASDNIALPKSPWLRLPSDTHLHSSGTTRREARPPAPASPPPPPSDHAPDPGPRKPDKCRCTHPHHCQRGHISEVSASADRLKGGSWVPAWASDYAAMIRHWLGGVWSLVRGARSMSRLTQCTVNSH
jgi:hypothetical protein